MAIKKDHRKRHFFWVGYWREDFGNEDWAGRFFVSGIITLIIHLLLFFLLVRGEASFVEEKKSPKHDVEIVFEEPEEQEMRYVEANSEVPIQEPDETVNFSARSQVAAQEELPEEVDLEGRPQVEGEEEESQAIMVGALEEPVAMPSLMTDEFEDEDEKSEELPPSELVEAMVSEEEYSDLPYLDEAVEDQEGEAHAFQDENEALAEVIDKVTDEPLDRFLPVVFPQLQEQVPQERTRPKPRPRPQVRSRAVPAPVMERHAGASKIGLVAIDARFSEFGEYIQRMIEAISYQWHLLAREFNFVRDVGSVAVLRFTLDREGSVKELEAIDGTASNLATLVCKDAVKSPSPFGAWSKDMVRTLGEQQEITFSFHY